MKIRWIACSAVLWLSLLFTLNGLAQRDDVPTSPQLVTWSPNGNYIGVSGYELMQVFETQTGTLVFDLSADGIAVLNHKWSADSNRVALLTGFDLGTGAELAVWDIRSQTRIYSTSNQLYQEQGFLTDFDWSADGQTIVLSQQGVGTNLLLLDTTSWQIRDRLSVTSPITEIALNPDNRRLAVSYSGITMQVLDLAASGNVLHTFEPESGFAIAFAWSPDGSQFALGYADGVVRIWDSATWIQRDSIFTGIDRPMFSISWSLDDSQIAVARSGASVGVWAVNTGELLFEGQPLMTFTTAFSPYSARVAYASLRTPNSPEAQTQVPNNSPNELHSLANGLVYIFVPDPTLERLHSIAALCDAPLTLPDAAQADQLSAFVAQVEALPAGSIPPACAADLIAVAEALQAE